MARIADSQAGAARSWGWNTIRLTLYVGDARSMPHAQSIIDEYTSQGFVVMVGSWDCTTLCPSVDQWFHDLAANNVNNSRVWYNCNNEPSADLGDWVTLQDQCVNDVRSAGNPNIVVADALVLPRTPAGRARVI